MLRVPDLFKFISGEVLKEEVDTRSEDKAGVEEPKEKKKGVLATMEEPKEKGKPDYGKEVGEGKIPNPKDTEEDKIKALLEKGKALLEQDIEGEAQIVEAPKIVYISDPDISEEEKLIGVVIEEDEDSYTVQYTETKTKKVKKEEAIPFELKKEEPKEEEPAEEPKEEEKPSESLYVLLDKDSKVIRESSGNVRVFKVEEEAKKEAEKIGARVVEIKK